LNEQLNVPLARLCGEQTVGPPLEADHVTLIVVLAGQPSPVTVIFVPVGPERGDTASSGLMTIVSVPR